MISRIPDIQAKKSSIPWRISLPRVAVMRFPESPTVFWPNPGSRKYPSRACFADEAFSIPFKCQNHSTDFHFCGSDDKADESRWTDFLVIPNKTDELYFASPLHAHYCCGVKSALEISYEENMDDGVG